MKPFKIALTPILSAVILLTACGEDNLLTGASNDIKIMTVSSVRDVLRDIVLSYKKKNTHSRIQMIVRPTGSIVEEIASDQSGSHVAILINGEQLNRLASANKLINLEKFGQNTFVLVGNAQAKSEIEGPSGIPALLANTHIAMNDPNTNASARYAMDMLRYYNVYDNVKDRVRLYASMMDTLQAVEVGLTNYGIIFITSALSSSAVKIIYNFPQESYTPVLYSVGAVSYNFTRSVQKFLDYIKSKPSQDTLTAYGFL